MIAIPRSYWDAQHGRGSAIEGPVDLVVVHHFGSLGPAFGAALSEEVALMRRAEHDHRQRRTSSGVQWVGLGYNQVVFQSGRIYEGRGWGRSGAHCPGKNSQSLGIAWAIDARVQYPKPESVSAVRDLLREGVAKGHLSPDFRVAGHGDFVATECPGPYLLEVLDELTRLDVPEPDFRSVDHIPERLRPLPEAMRRPV